MYWIILLILLLLSSNIYIFYLYSNLKQSKTSIEELNKETEKENQEIKKTNELLLNQQKEIKNSYEEKQQELVKIQETINNAEQASKKAFENYNDILNKQYIQAEKEHDEAIILLEKSYQNIQNGILSQIESVQSDLDKISSTRAAAIQAQLKEEEIKQQEKYYSITISDIDKKEVRILQSIESELRDPRPIRMIIWQAYYSKRANELAARVLGSNDICGIYKITNKKNNMCYIGQAKNIRERFREHMKCGLGIDAPANNKLYIAMKEEGLEAFTFELIEECNSTDLDKKENFYIKLYDSYNFGYNNNKGIKKG